LARNNSSAANNSSTHLRCCLALGPGLGRHVVRVDGRRFLHRNGLKRVYIIYTMQVRRQHAEVQVNDHRFLHRRRCVAGREWRLSRGVWVGERERDGREAAAQASQLSSFGTPCNKGSRRCTHPQGQVDQRLLSQPTRLSMHKHSKGNTAQKREQVRTHPHGQVDERLHCP